MWHHRVLFLTQWNSPGIPDERTASHSSPHQRTLSSPMPLALAGCIQPGADADRSRGLLCFRPGTITLENDRPSSCDRWRNLRANRSPLNSARQSPDSPLALPPRPLMQLDSRYDDSARCTHCSNGCAGRILAITSSQIDQTQLASAPNSDQRIHSSFLVMRQRTSGTGASRAAQCRWQAIDEAGQRCQFRSATRNRSIRWAPVSNTAEISSSLPGIVGRA